MNWETCPEGIRGGLQRYIAHGIAPGHFLTAVLCNDLKEAFNRADLENTRRMRDIVAWLYNNVPAECWGSKEKFNAWTGLVGAEQVAD